MLEYTEKFLKRWQGDALIHGRRRAAFDLYVRKRRLGFGGAGGKYSARF